jgi:small subunit ribosomal protein S4
MARYTGPTARLCRREGSHLALKGTECDRGKCSSDKRAYPPGQHGQLRVKLSDYGIQLREKQKVKRMYGMLEKQFRRSFEVASKAKGVTGQQLLEILERRLDNVAYRMGIATSRREGRQMVSHRSLLVNGKPVNIPSYQVKVGDVVAIAPVRKGQAARAKHNLETTKSRPVPAWIQVDAEKLSGTIVRAPQRDDIGAGIQEQLIVELYSK